MNENEASASPRTNLQNTGSSIFPMYKCYPADDTRIDTNKPATTFPESNRHVMMALKDLQEKIIQLERERNEALSSLQELTSQPRPAFASTQNFPSESSDNRHDQPLTLQDIADISSKLDDAEQRCQILNQQLIDVKPNPTEQTLEQHTIQSTLTSPLPRQVTNKQQRTCFKTPTALLSEEKDKLSILRELAEKNIRALECKLQHEKRYQQMIEDKTLLLNRTTLSGSYQSKQKTATTFSTVSHSSPKSRRGNPDVSFYTLENWSHTQDEDVDGLLFELREEMVQLERSLINASMKLRLKFP